MRWKRQMHVNHINMEWFALFPLPAPGSSLYNDNRGKPRHQMIDIKKKLQDEIAVLEHELHVDLPKEILKAREHGDLSENAEYHAAKDRQGLVNARLGQLKKRLAEISMVD